jgi:Protein of unknown function (DUF3617)
MRPRFMAIAAGLLLTACSDDSATSAKSAAEPAEALRPGEYEVTAKVDALRSTDKTVPKTAAKASAVTVTRTCVPADGSLNPATFAEAGEKCTASDTYLRRGRMSLQYKCNRAGDIATQMMDGSFTADSFTGKVTTATYFSGSGDYAMTRTMTGKRIGECPAASAESEAGKAKG